MGLRNLKSAFSNVVVSSEIQGRHSESPTETIPIIPSSILEATTYAYNSITDEPIDLDGGMAPADVLDKITKGEVVQYAVTIPEGYSLDQIAGILQENGLVNEDEFIQLTQDPVFLAKLDFKVEDLEGYLFPDTYHFTQQVEPEIMVQTMIERFKQVWTDQLATGAM